MSDARTRGRQVWLLVAVTAAVMVGRMVAGTPADAAVAAGGQIAFNSYKTGDGDIYVVNPDGTGELNVTGDQPEGEGHDDQGPDWSPDGAKIAFTRYIANQGSDIYTVNPDGTGLTAITGTGGVFQNEKNASQPDWSPDGTKFAYNDDQDGNPEILTMNVDGSGSAQLTQTAYPTRNVNAAWSPDGSEIAFASNRMGAGQDIFVMAADGTGVTNLTNVNNTNVNLWHPTWSPDGTKIAYARHDSTTETWDVWMMTADGTGAVNVTASPEIDSEPSFSPDGTQISFIRYTPETYSYDVWMTDVPATTVQSMGIAAGSARAAATETKVTTNGSAHNPDWGGPGGTTPPPPSGKHTLTASRAGNGTGSVVSTPSGIKCGTDCTEDYAAGTAVTLTARAASGSTFAGWSGACSGTATTCAVTMDAAKSVTATFTTGTTPPPPGGGPYTLTVTRDGTGRGTVTSSPAGISCGRDCSEAYASGTQVTLTATAASGYSFSGWSGACSGTATTCTVTMDAAKSVTATFGTGGTTPPPGETHTLTVTKGGTGGGRVTSSPAGISCGSDCSETYASGTSVTLTATAASGSTFTGWSGACTGTGATCTVTMNAAKTATATFNKI